MSAMPPNPPPPYQPNDPKTQWRVYREQQRAAWRAQREAWKAQRHAWKAGYRGGVYIPRVPSVVGPVLMIAIGVVAMLVVTGRIGSVEFWSWYNRWWPLLLIGAGLAMLGEWALDLRRQQPVRRGGNFAGILILLALLGYFGAGWNNWWGPFRAHFGGQGEDFFNAFGLPEHNRDQRIESAPIPAYSSIEIQNPRGDVSITGDDVSSVQVVSHEIAFTGSDSEARKIFDAEAAHLSVSGSNVLVRSESSNSGRLNLSVTVPRSARVTVKSARGDVTAEGVGGINASAANGDVHLTGIHGQVQAHLANGKHDLTVRQIDGDLTADGDLNDLTLADIRGKIAQSGEILGDVHVENVGGSVHLHTSITDLQLAALPGELTLDSDNLRVSEAQGQVRVVTRAKDIDLSHIAGDTFVDDTRGQISIEPAGAYGVTAKNGKGDVEVTLPANASASVEGHTRNGDIVTDFGLVIRGEEAKTVSGRIGGGAARISLSADVGDLRIKKGAATTSEPAAEAAPNALHLRTPKALPAHPVMQ